MGNTVKILGRKHCTAAPLFASQSRKTHTQRSDLPAGALEHPLKSAPKNGVPWSHLRMNHKTIKQA